MMIIAFSLYLASLYKATHIKGIVCCCSVALRLRDEIWNFTMVMSKFHLSVEWKHAYSSIIILIFFSFRDLNIPVPGQRGFYK